MVKQRRRWSDDPPVPTKGHGNEQCRRASPSFLYDACKIVGSVALILAIAVLVITWVLEAAEEHRRKELDQRPQPLLSAGSAALNRYFDRRYGMDGGGSSTQLEVKTHWNMTIQ